jgi:hypothetical protein
MNGKGGVCMYQSPMQNARNQSGVSTDSAPSFTSTGKDNIVASCPKQSPLHHQHHSFERQDLSVTTSSITSCNLHLPSSASVIRHDGEGE